MLGFARKFKKNYEKFAARRSRGLGVLIGVPEENWTRYEDTDGALKEVAFFTAFFSERFRASFENGEKIGFALTKQEGKKLPVILGDMYKTQDGAFTVAGLDAGEREWSGD